MKSEVEVFPLSRPPALPPYRSLLCKLMLDGGAGEAEAFAQIHPISFDFTLQRSVCWPRIGSVFIAALSLLMSAPAPAQVEPAPHIPAYGKSIGSFVPEGFHVLASKEADFNGDGLTDVVVVLEADDEVLRYEQPRPLIVLFKQRDGGYRLSGRSDNAVPTAPPGVHGDRFEGIKIRRNTFIVTSGGSSGAGSSGDESQEQYRYQNGDWYLIGTQEHTWNYPLNPSSDSSYLNAEWCPQLHLAPEYVCRELQRSVNFNTREKIDQWDVYPVAGSFTPGENFRTTALREKLPRKPLTPMSQINNNQ